MGRASTIAGTAIEGKVNELLDRGASFSEVSKLTGAHPSSVQRWSVIRKSQPARVTDGEPNLYDMLSRLGQTLDDAREVRRASRTSSPATRARAIQTEVSVIEKILDQLGISDASVFEAMEQAHEVITAVRDHALEDRDASDIIPRLRAIPGLEDAAAALQGRLEKTA